MNGFKKNIYQGHSLQNKFIIPYVVALCSMSDQRPEVKQFEDKSKHIPKEFEMKIKFLVELINRDKPVARIEDLGGVTHCGKQGF